MHDAPIGELTTPGIVRALKAIEAKDDRRETAHRCGMLVGRITRFAVNHGYAAVNVLPMGQLRGALKPVKTDSHAAIIEPERFGKLLKFIDLYADFAGSRAQPGVSSALKLAPLIFIRPAELRRLEWSEVDFAKKEIVIPAAKMKMRTPHVVPLAKQSIAILKAAHKVTGRDRYCFRTRRLDEALSENGFREALNTILGAMGEPRGVHTIPTETGTAWGSLARFFGLRPGDIIALKAHSAPVGTRPRLVIARYAVVTGANVPRYKRHVSLGHTYSVDFLDPLDDPIEFAYGYRGTIHKITDQDRLDAIFGAYPAVSHLFATKRRGSSKPDRVTHKSVVAAREQYVMKRVHNELQNQLRHILEKFHGNKVVGMEENWVDLAFTLPGRYIIFEVKSSPSPTQCIREALGQMLHNAWKKRRPQIKVEFYVVGPLPLQARDAEILEYIKSHTGLPVSYCRPSDYVPHLPAET